MATLAISAACFANKKHTHRYLVCLYMTIRGNCFAVEAHIQLESERGCMADHRQATPVVDVYGQVNQIR